MKIYPFILNLQIKKYLRKLQSPSFRISTTICSIVVLFALNSCNTTKYVPKGEYLLNKAKIEITDDKPIDKDALKGYLRQRENSEILGFWKLQLHIYNLSGRDTTKWINLAVKAMGEQPEILDSAQTDFSARQLTQALHNKGYFNAEVTPQTTVLQSLSKKPTQKTNVTYNIKAGEPYLLRDYSLDLDTGELYDIASMPRSLVQRGMLFDADVFNQERERIANSMTRQGYYMFDKDFLNYSADSTGLDHQVDAELSLRSFFNSMPDSIRKRIFTKYKIRRVIFEQEPNSDLLNNLPYDTIYHSDSYVFISRKGQSFLRPSVLIRNCHIVPGTYYNSRMLELTNSSLNALSAVKYANVSFKLAGADELDCIIHLTKSKAHTLSAEVEGTYSAGDWGVAGQLGYGHKNIFKGSEEFNLTGRGAYEWRQIGGTASEWNIKASLSFPNLTFLNIKHLQRRVNTKTDVSLQYNYQNRPNEYTRTIAAATLKNTWIPLNTRWRQSFSFLDVSYVYLPWISDDFRNQFLSGRNILKYSYEDHFILDWNYSGAYSSYNQNQPLRSYFSVNWSVETAGNLLYGIASAAKMERTDDDNSYKMFNIRFSQYAKGDISLSVNHIFNANHRIVWHAGIGVAVPYGNSQSIPFEKRYFSGGANSVRGWQARALGPGSYRSTTGSLIDFNNQAGDVKLDLNLEYRFKIAWRLHGAIFTDAGNIWTIRDYETQPGGQFKFNEFYKQIAWSYGLGIRLDFSVFVFRIDCGIKLYDPSRISDGTQWRQPNWKDDVTFHFAIGYPF